MWNETKNKWVRTLCKTRQWVRTLCKTRLVFHIVRTHCSFVLHFISQYVDFKFLIVCINKLCTRWIYLTYFLYLPKRIEFLSNVNKGWNLFNSHSSIFNHSSFTYKHSKKKWSIVSMSLLQDGEPINLSLKR